MMPRGNLNKPRRERVVWQSYPCETCGATPGQPCVTYSGTAKQEPHAPRARLAEARGWLAADEPEPAP